MFTCSCVCMHVYTCKQHLPSRSHHGPHVAPGTQLEVGNRKVTSFYQKAMPGFLERRTEFLWRKWEKMEVVCTSLSTRAWHEADARLLEIRRVSCGVNPWCPLECSNGMCLLAPAFLQTQRKNKGVLSNVISPVKVSLFANLTQLRI